MAKEFRSLSAFSKHISYVVNQYDRREKNILTIIGRFIEIESKNIIGHRQYGISGSGFGYWQDLAESTKIQKERLGYGDASNEWQPLLRTGELRESISYQIEPQQVYIGSTSDIMVYQEEGTVHIPPRPVLGWAMYKERDKLEKSISNFMYAWITDTKAKGKIS